jgi:hypothetical protein
MLQKYPETSKRFLKAMILGMQVAKHNKKEAIQIGIARGLPGEPELINRSYDLSARATPPIFPSPTTVFRSCSMKIFAPASSTKNSPSNASSTTGF